MPWIQQPCRKYVQTSHQVSYQALQQLVWFSILAKAKPVLAPYCDWERNTSCMNDTDGASKSFLDVLPDIQSTRISAGSPHGQFLVLCRPISEALFFLGRNIISSVDSCS